MKKWSMFAGFNLVLVFIDQLTKHFAQKNLMGTEGISIIDNIFRLQYLENIGAAFGILENKMIYFILGTLLVLIGICYVYQKLPENKHYLPLRFISIFLFAGATGNFIDRIINNYVIDFFYFELIDFPIFNVADCYITISAGFLLVFGIFYYKDEDFQFLKWKKDTTHDECQ